MKIKLDPGAYMPIREHPADAGLDLRCREDAMLWKDGSAVFDTGVHVQLPHGWHGQVVGRSGLNINDGIVCLQGTIDESYTGSIVVKLYNLSGKCYRIRKGDKVAQLVIIPYAAPELELVDDLEETERGDAGFGSTGR